MRFYEILDQVVDLLRRRGRVTYRALKREFQVDDAFLEATDGRAGWGPRDFAEAVEAEVQLLGGVGRRFGVEDDLAHVLAFS